MLKVVKRPKEYIAIKVPEDCEDIGKFVIKEAKAAGIHLHIATTYYDHADKWITRIDTQGSGSGIVNQGSVIVVPDFADEYSAYVMSQKDFDNLFKPADELVKASPIVVEADAKKIWDKFAKINAEMSTKIEGVTLPDHKNVPHVRIEFDDINDVPRVWIDGKRLGDEYPLKRINLEWNTNDAYIEPKHFLIDYFDMTKEAGAVAEQYGPQTQQRGVGQSNGVVRRSSTPRSEEE